MSDSEPNANDHPNDENANNEDQEVIEQEIIGEEEGAQGSSNDLSTQLEESKQKYLYLLSEFETYKRRMARERIDLFRNAGKDLIVELLPVLDDFERGLEVMSQSSDVVAIRDGVDLVYQKFKNLLTQKGLQSIVSVGAEFDVEKHEAISRMPASSPDQVNKVVAEVEKGYLLNEQVLRFSKVIVGV
ncbi:MAG: nucleotide exchange factor GrpE [Bacteroidota bacterium]